MTAVTTVICLWADEELLPVSVVPSFLPSSATVVIVLGSVSVVASDPADVAAARNAFAGAYHQLVGELVARGEWVECDRCDSACARSEASFPHDGPDKFGNYDLLGTLCPSCAPDDDAGRAFGLPLAEYVPVPGDAAPEPF